MSAIFFILSFKVLTVVFLWMRFVWDVTFQRNSVCIFMGHRVNETFLFIFKLIQHH